MKQFSLVLVTICLLISSVMAQSKMEFGLTAEGSWFMPGKYSTAAPSNKDGLGAGIGFYASQNIFGKLSADVGLMYRYKQMQEYYEKGVHVAYNSNEGIGGYGGYSGYGNYGYDPGANFSYYVEPSSPFVAEGWKKYPLNYIVLPVHINYFFYKSIFVRGGVEASFLANNDAPNEKTEFNWTIGIGCHHYKLKGSVNYLRGFKDVAFANALYFINGYPSTPVYRNNMIQLSLSYPLWQKI